MAPGLSAVYPPSRSFSEPVERIRHTIQVGIVEIRIGVRGDYDRRMAHRHLQQFRVRPCRSGQRSVGVPEVMWCTETRQLLRAGAVHGGVGISGFQRLCQPRLSGPQLIKV
jgi:hypothetical protein